MLLQAAARTARLLAKEGHFTFSTNHGIMQNIALLRYCIAFPELPGVEEYKNLAI